MFLMSSNLLFICSIRKLMARVKLAFKKDSPKEETLETGRKSGGYHSNSRVW